MTKVIIRDSENEYENFLNLTKDQITFLRWLEENGYLGIHVEWIDMDVVEFDTID